MNDVVDIWGGGREKNKNGGGLVRSKNQVMRKVVLAGGAHSQFALGEIGGGS